MFERIEKQMPKEEVKNRIILSLYGDKVTGSIRFNFEFNSNIFKLKYSLDLTNQHQVEFKWVSKYRGIEVMKKPMNV